MSAQTRSISPQNFVEIIKEISELAKNPSMIKDLHDGIIKQNELTENELKKIEDAREFIAKYEALNAEIKVKNEFLEKEKGLHLEKVTAFNSYCKENQELLDKAKKELEVKQQEFQTKLIEHEDRVNKLTSYEEELKKTYHDNATFLSQKEDIFQVMVENCYKKEKELEDREAILSKKEAKLKSYLAE